MSHKHALYGGGLYGICECEECEREAQRMFEQEKLAELVRDAKDIQREQEESEGGEK